MVTAKNRGREGDTGSPNPVQILKRPKGNKMAKKTATTGKLSEILKKKMEIDFCCPRCEGTKLDEMQGTGRMLLISADGRSGEAYSPTPWNLCPLVCPNTLAKPSLNSNPNIP